MSFRADSERAMEPDRGRDAVMPTRIPFNGWRDISWRVLVGLQNQRVMLMAAGVTFYILLALVPTLSCFVSIYGLFVSPDTTLSQVQLLSGIVPAGGLDIVRNQLMRLTAQGNQTLGVTLIVSLTIALWSAGSGVRAVFEAMNVVYHEREKRNFFVVNGIALLFTIGGTIAAIFVVGGLLVIPALLRFFWIGGIQTWLVQIAGYAGMLLAVTFGLAALYRWGPSRKNAKWRWITPGSALAIVATILTSLAFSWYTGNITDFDATYGSLGSIIGLLMWVWLSVAIVIIGGSLNSEIEHQTARDTTEGTAERPLGSRGAYVADTVGKGAPIRRINSVLRRLRNLWPK